METQGVRIPTYENEMKMLMKFMGGFLTQLDNRNCSQMHMRGAIESMKIWWFDHCASDVIFATKREGLFESLEQHFDE
jgi:hypothetical protein